MSDVTQFQDDHWNGTRNEEPGTRIGAYTLTRRIGEGGFGDVWEAAQEQPVKRSVALKILKLGMDTREVIARFDLERQALAMMEHPHIAHVLDAGATASGRPYFVMELVAGEPITDYCDRLALPIDARLKLFEQVCAAVQHAHTKGLIHRDLKPGNVLVFTQDEQPFAKVIDFGIAKAVGGELGERTRATRIDQVMGTPLYMSPEQARGLADIDTRTDIYALGVILYELLSGSTPVERSALSSVSLADTQRLICESEPPVPSARLAKAATTGTRVGFHASAARMLARSVRGELDWIVMKAIEKDRSRRYDTANAFAADVRRYLDGQPVLAAPPSRAYRAAKFIRRHKGPVLAAALVVASLIAGVVAFAWQARIAQQQERLAQKRADDLKQVADFQAEMLGKVEPIRIGKSLREDVMAKYAAALTQAKLPTGERDRLIQAFSRQWDQVNSADTASALIDRTILTPAAVAIDRQFPRQPLVAAALRQALADSYTALGLFDKAMPLQTAALDTRRRLLGDDDADTQYSMQAIGALLDQSGDLTVAETWLRRALAARRRLHGESHRDTLQSMASLGTVLEEQGKFAEGEPLLRRALESRRRLFGKDDADVADAETRLGGLLLDRGKPDDALPLLRQAMDDGLRIHGEDDASTINSINDVGVAWMSKHMPDKAEPYFRRAFELHLRLQGAEHPETVQAQANLGGVMMAAGKTAEAEPILRSAIDKSTRVLGADNPTTLLAMASLGKILVDKGSFVEAEHLLAPVESDAKKALADASPPQLGFLLTVLGMAQAGQREFASAEITLLAAHAAFENSPGGSRGTYPTMCMRALADLYGGWDKAKPGNGYAAKSAEWKAKLDATNATATGAK